MSSCFIYTPSWLYNRPSLNHFLWNKSKNPGTRSKPAFFADGEFGLHQKVHFKRLPVNQFCFSRLMSWHIEALADTDGPSNQNNIILRNSVSNSHFKVVLLPHHVVVLLCFNEDIFSSKLSSFTWVARSLFKVWRNLGFLRQSLISLCFSFLFLFWHLTNLTESKTGQTNNAGN